MSAGDFVEDLLGGFGPDEGLGVVVPSGSVGGVKLPLALAELGLIDEYEFLVQPRLAGHGPTLFAGLSKRVDLKLVSLSSAKIRSRALGLTWPSDAVA